MRSQGKPFALLFAVTLGVASIAYFAFRDRPEDASRAPLSSPSESAAASPDSTAAPDPSAPRERSVPPESERTPAIPALPPAAPDLKLAAALARDGAADVRLLDAAGRPVASAPVLVLPESTWQWLRADPDGPDRYLGNLRASSADTVLRSGADGTARATFLPRSGALRVIAGEGAWVASSSPAFESGAPDAPAKIELVLHPRAAIEVRVRDGAGNALPVLSALAKPAAESGVADVRVAAEDRTRSAPHVLRLEPLPAGIACDVEATVLLDGRACIARGLATPEIQRTVVLELLAETRPGDPTLPAREEKPKR